MAHQQEVSRTVAQIRNQVSDAAVVEEASGVVDDDVHAVIPESDIGSFYGAVRQTDADAEMLRNGDEIRGFLNL